MSNVTNVTDVARPAICEKGGSGLFLPFFTNEYEWPVALRAILYCLGLGWMFMGVAIVADVFMVSIEEITSKRKAVTIKGRTFYVKTWNDTVANLTLMALGSSAPEILLSVLEVFSLEFFAGDLGPSTIVGSAAFNLLVISAVCIVGIPKGEIRKINDLGVFAVTCSFSIWAYIWLLIVLMVWTPNVVSLAEGVITFLFFPLVVGLAFAADKGYFSRDRGSRGIGGTDARVLSASGGEFPPEKIATTLKQVREEYGEKISEEQANKLATFRLLGQRKKSRAEYRIEATRKMSGGKIPVRARLNGIDDPEIIKKELERARQMGVKVGKGSVAPSKEADLEEGDGTSSKAASTSEVSPDASIVQFSAAMHGFLESAGTIRIAVQRLGNTEQPVTVQYETRDGTACSGEDYIAAAGELSFASGECVKDIEVTLVDDNQWEPDETFDVVLRLPSAQPDDCRGCVLGDPAISTITIINDDEPGILYFTEDEYVVNEREGKVLITVKRKNGSDGTVTCKYGTQDHADKTAVAGADYEPVSGTLVFDHAEIEKTFTVPIVNDESYEKDERFQVILTEATGGARFDDATDGSTEHEISVVKIVNDRELKSVIDRISHGLNINRDRMNLGSSNWKQQFIDALKPGGDDDDEEESSEDAEPPSTMDWVFHYIALPWKLLFATVPPTDFAGGWLCFIVSLTYIGVVTGFIGDLASLFGCVIGLKDSVTAITFVALGTSLPDTFASMAAAAGDPYADAAIGNVTGSNAVNVFLGLGLPWLMASIYWATFKEEGNAAIVATYKNKYSGFSWFKDLGSDFHYIVPAGDLGVSVATFTGLALACVAVLMTRRRIAGGELGGPNRLRYISAALLVSFWLIYIIVSSINAYAQK